MSTHTDTDTDPDTEPSSTADAQMPDRYKPDPIVTSTVSRAGKSQRDTPSGKIPILALRDWLELTPPTTLSVAPRDDAAVRVGPRVPSILDDLTVGEAMKYNGAYPTATLPLSVLEYLGAAPGDELAVEHVADDTLEIRLRPDT